MSDPTIEFVVWGDPVTAGSKQAMPVMRRDGVTGRMVPVLDHKGHPVVRLLEDKERRKRGETWRGLIAQAAQAEMGDDDLLAGALAVQLIFFRRRPKGHYGTGRNAGVLKDSAAARPTGAPDVDKLTRAALDALKNIVWTDDSQVVELLVRKEYGPKPGMRFRLWELGDTMNDVVAASEDGGVVQLQLSIA